MWNESSAGLSKLQRAQWRDLNWHLAIILLVGCFDVLVDLLPLVLHYGNGREMKVSLYISPLCSTLSDRGLKSSPAIRDSVRLLCINLYWPACHLQLLLFSLFTFLFCPANLLVTFSLFFWVGGIVFELMFQTNLLAGVFMKCYCIRCDSH